MDNQYVDNTNHDNTNHDETNHDDIDQYVDEDSVIADRAVREATTYVSESSVVNNAYLTLAYENTDFEREYKFSNVSSSALSGIASAVVAYNANVPVKDKAVFVSNEGDPMTSIKSAKAEVITSTYIIKR